MTARSEPEIFETFKGEHQADGLRFREWWRRYWFDHIDDYFERKWYLFPCGRYSKRPLAGWKWGERSLGYEEAVWHAALGENLAVVAGFSGVIAIDMDSEAVKPFDTDTLTMQTPRGYQYWASPPYDDRLGEKLRRAGFDNPRAGNMYSLVPLSRTFPCHQEGKENGCLVHQRPKIREWVNFGAECKPFRKVAKELVG